MRLILFGASGAIGTAISDCFKKQGWMVTGITRSVSKHGLITWNPLSQSAANCLDLSQTFDAVCWAQGTNMNDSIYNFDSDKHLELYESNVLYILSSLRQLIDHQLLSKKAKLCVISSIWQNLSRQEKLSYGVTKSALQGLVLSLANDMAKDGYMVNAILPGALDTPMTRKNLSDAQLSKIESATGFGKLPLTDDVANSVFFLCSELNTGITGQFIKVDYGYSDVRRI